MNKTAIKNFAIWARNKLIADISYRAGLMGITADGIQKALPQSTGTTEFYDIGTVEPYSISGDAVKQRKHLVELIQRKEKETNYKTAYKYVLEEVAYTWFNRLIAVRFMEVNDYLPSHIRVLSSDSGKMEPDLVTNPFSAGLSFTSDEEQAIYQLKQENKLDEVFRILFIKQCNALNENLPALFEKTSDYTELLLNLSVIDQDGVVYHLVNDIPEEDFDVERGGQVEIIGWLYQFYNTELNNEVYDGSMAKERVPKELLPAATTIYTPDWPIRYMVENSLGRLWMEGHPNDDLKSGWKYYLEEAEQELEVQVKLAEIQKEYAQLKPEDIKIIDPCMGSGHILVYAFDVLMQIYESAGYGQRDAARSILESNLYGLDIDDRAFQMAYFAVMMKARQYNRRILNGEYNPNVYSIQESNGINRNQLRYFGAGLNELEKDTAVTQITELLDIFKDAKEYGSILNVEQYDWNLLNRFVTSIDVIGQLSFYTMGLDETAELLKQVIKQGQVLSDKYDIVITNPPYLNHSRYSTKLNDYSKKNYNDVKTDLCTIMYRKALGDLVKKWGMVSFITTSSWMVLSSFEKLRKFLFLNGTIVSMIDFGTELFDGKVGHNPIVSWVTRKASIDYRFNAVRLTDFCFSKRSEKEPQFFNPSNRYVSRQNEYGSIPGTPIAYWVSEKVFSAFENNPKLGDLCAVKNGMSTTDNKKYTRAWFECQFDKIGLGMHDAEEAIKSGKRWFPYNKGGEYKKWYGNVGVVVDWENDGERIKESAKGATGGRIVSQEYYFQRSLSWSKVSSGAFSLRMYPEGFLFDVAGPGIFADYELQLYILALMNSKLNLRFLKELYPTMNYEMGQISSFPIKRDERIKAEVCSIAKENIEISYKLTCFSETSWSFTGNPLVGKSNSVEEAIKLWISECNNLVEKVRCNEERLNYLFINSYGLDGELRPDVDIDDVTISVPTKSELVKDLISFAVGCMFGRYSLDSEGLVKGKINVSSKSKTAFIVDYDNIVPITDEEYFEDDIVNRFVLWLENAFGFQNKEANLEYIANTLGNEGNNSREIIRNYFMNDFFANHCSNYSIGTLTKRPVYWLFDSGRQNGFRALIYLHRYNADTIGNLRIDYLHRMQRIYESEISRMQDMIDHSPSGREVAQATKRREKLTKQLKECREYDEKLAHLALSRIELDLDDGVKKNYRKIQTANDGKFYEVLADSKNIMSKE